MNNKPNNYCPVCGKDHKSYDVCEVCAEILELEMDNKPNKEISDEYLCVLCNEHKLDALNGICDECVSVNENDTEELPF